MIFAITQKLFIGPRPNLQSINEWADMLCQNDISHVISLISAEEIIAYGIENEETILAQKNIGFSHFAINDYDVPDEEQFIENINKFIALQNNNKKLFIHCAGGVGRAGTLAACLLVAQGYDCDSAIKLVSEKRGRPSPETKAQIEFVQQYQKYKFSLCDTTNN